MKIIIICKTKREGKQTFQARVFGVNPPLHSFAESEIKALKQLAEKLEKINPKYIRQ